MPREGHAACRRACVATGVSLATLWAGGAASARPPAVPQACLRSLDRAAAALFCDRRPAREAAVRLAARGFHGERVATGTRRIAVLYGPRPLRAGATVRLAGGRPTRRARLALAYLAGSRLTLVTFSGFGGPRAPRRATVVSRRRARGGVAARMRIGRRSLQPRARRVIRWRGPTAAAGITPPPTAPQRPGMTAPAAAPRSPPSPPPPSDQRIACGAGRTADATSDRQHDRLWARSGDGWTGGDGATSVGLPDSRTLWLFGDSFLGTVGPDGSRSADTPMVRNAAVVQAGANLSTVPGPGGGALFQSASDDEWYWPAAAVVEGDVVRVFLWRFAKAGDGPWGFRYTSPWIATLSLPALAVTGVVPLDPRGSSVAWGAATIDDGAWTYIYGIEDHRATKYAHVARARQGDLLGAWEFFTGTGWSSDPRASARVFDQAAPLISVLKVAQGYSLVASEGMFGRRIFAWWAPTPTGPWLDRRTLYTTPQSGRRTFTYNAVAHTELAGAAGLLISYSVNSFDPWDVYADAANYRPRFIRVPLSCLSVP